MWSDLGDIETVVKRIMMGGVEIVENLSELTVWYIYEKGILV